MAAPTRLKQSQVATDLKVFSIDYATAAKGRGGNAAWAWSSISNSAIHEVGDDQIQLAQIGAG
jgi:hypothetical protein